MSDPALSPPSFVVLFESELTANLPVAGIPAAVRALQRLRDDRYAATGFGKNGGAVPIAVPGGWMPSGQCVAEAERLLPGVEFQAVDANKAEHDKVVFGARLLIGSPANSGRSELDQLRQAGREIVISTGKPGDGIVSRHINRPISRALTRIVLLWSGARPWHATLVAALIGAVMLAALLSGGTSGLLAGAVLFQIASIVDGVDGEIARATMRSSARGAMMDSLTDAATNLGFIGGVSYNLYAQGVEQAGIVGAIGCGVLALGSTLLAIQSRRDGGDFTFDALKARFRAKPSRLKQWLVWIAMRDFYALASCIAILAGGARFLLYAFAFVASGWFLLVCRMVAGSRAKRL